VVEVDDYPYQQPTLAVEKLDAETQTDSLQALQNEMAIQTEPPESRVGITQTATVKTSEEDCQTEEVITFARDVQVDLRPEVVQSGTDCQTDLLEQLEKEITSRVHTKVKEEHERAQAAKKRLSLIVPIDSSGGVGGSESSVSLDNIVNAPPKVLNTTKNNIKKIEFNEGAMAKSPDAGPHSNFSFVEQKNLDYMLNRDPMNEFFTLTCQSIKLNSPHMNTICHIDTNSLYRKAQKMNVPFFKWASWIEAYLNKEFMRAVLAKSRRPGLKPETRTFIKAEQATKQRILDQAKYFNQELEAHKAHHKKATKGKDRSKEKAASEKKKEKAASASDAPSTTTSATTDSSKQKPSTTTRKHVKTLSLFK
jgi:hypothetical protein